MDHFGLPLLLNRFEEIRPYLPHASLECADLQGLIASWGAALQFPENITAAPFRIGLEPGEDLFPFSLKGVFVGTPPAEDPFSSLLLAVQGLESCWWNGSIPHFRKTSRCTLCYRKDVERVGKGE